MITVALRQAFGNPAFAVVAVVLLAPGWATAQADDLIGADRPALANGSATVGRGRLQLEVGLDRSHDDLELNSLATPFLLRVGVVDALELRVEGDGRRWANSSHTESENGWAPVAVGFKYRFVAESGARPAVGLIARVFPASGSGVYRSALATGDLVLTLDKGLDDHWSVTPNVGVAWIEDDREERVRGDEGSGFTAVRAALAVQYSFRPSLRVFVDVAWQDPEVPHESPVWIVDLGSAWIVGRDTQLDVSLGWGAGGLRVPTWFGSAGISRRF